MRIIVFSLDALNNVQMRYYSRYFLLNVRGLITYYDEKISGQNKKLRIPLPQPMGHIF